MPKVVRRLLARGRVYVVECAVLADGKTAPCDEMLESLKAGELYDDPDHLEGEPWPDEDQPDDYFQFMAMTRCLAEKGLPMHQRAVNVLQDGIWELKRGKKRLSFYDTDGVGGYEPKVRIRDRAEASNEDEYWWFPDFDDYIRVGHGFMKVGETTGPQDIEATQKVREEDLAHDRIESEPTAISS